MVWCWNIDALSSIFCGKRREVNWQPMGEEAIATFNTDTTTRGFTGHEQIDTVGLIHMNGRVYDAELGRFLSADPHIQALDNLQNFNRYSYVLNNPLSYTDPTGFFFSKLFKAIGKAFGKIFKAIGRAFKKLLRSPIFRAIIQIVACANPVTGIQCAIISGALAAAEGGSLSDVFKAVAFSFIAPEVLGAVGGALDGVGAIGQALVHGVVNGALTVAQGGNFIAGCASGAIGKLGGLAGQRLFGPYGSSRGVMGRAFISAIAGCAGAVVSGGKCANGAVSAAFASLYNGDRQRPGIGHNGGPPIDEGGSWLLRIFGRLGGVFAATSFLSGDVMHPLQPNQTSDGLYHNLFPDDPVVLQNPARTLVKDWSGRWWLVSQSGGKLTPSGSYDFVTLPNGTIRVARPNTNEAFSTHLGLSGGGPVKYAGRVNFHNNNKGPLRGTMRSWDNSSGHYRPYAGHYSQAGIRNGFFSKFKF